MYLYYHTIFIVYYIHWSFFVFKRVKNIHLEPTDIRCYLEKKILFQCKQNTFYCITAYLSVTWYDGKQSMEYSSTYLHYNDYNDCICLTIRWYIWAYAV